jgi:ribosome biogenesis GTPase
MNLIDLGYNDFFKSQFEELKENELIPARVSCEQRNIYTLLTEQGEFPAEVTGKYRHEAKSRGDFPSVGDWVAVKIAPQGESASIHTVLKRKSVFSRLAVLDGITEQQVLAANIDTAFLVSGLDNEFNLRRIERYLAVTWDSGANPVIVLNKSDMCDDIESVISDVETIAMGIPILPVSATTNESIDTLLPYLKAGQTVVFLGSSGVGKSTLINKILGEDRQLISDVREYDNKGRHTTTYRELIPLPNGGMLIDTPGMREIQMWGDEDSLKKAFDDIESLAGSCRFKDCIHDTEPGCAVKQAIEDGTLDSNRLKSYRKQQRELISLNMRKSARARHLEKIQGKKFASMVKEVYKYKHNKK